MSLITLSNVSLSYPVYTAQSKSLRNVFLSKSTGGYLRRESRNVVVVEALKDVSISLENGDKVAILGPNGAGKTTILKLLGSILEPSSGAVNREGQISLMLGLTPTAELDATGLDNIYLAGYARGLSKAEINFVMPRIVEFSEIGDYISMPMRIYSTGMLTRLIFSINVTFPSDILLVDEVFGAGDASFIDKATEKMKEFVGNTNIYVFASHNEGIIRQTCNRGILLDKGRIVCDGNLGETLDHYKELLSHSPK